MKTSRFSLAHLPRYCAQWPQPQTAQANQRSFADLLESARPSHSSSRLPLVGLRENGTSDFTYFDPSTGVLGNRFRDSLKHSVRRAGLITFAVVFPGRDDRQDSTFSRKKFWRAAGAHFPAVPARVRHASEGVPFFKVTNKQPQ